MSAVDQTIQNQANKCEADVRAYLCKAGEETIFYLATCKYLKHNMADKFGLTED